MFQETLISSTKLKRLTQSVSNVEALLGRKISRCRRRVGWNLSSGKTKGTERQSDKLVLEKIKSRYLPLTLGILLYCTRDNSNKIPRKSFKQPDDEKGISRPISSQKDQVKVGKLKSPRTINVSFVPSLDATLSIKSVCCKYISVDEFGGI